MTFGEAFGKCLTGQISLAGTRWRPALKTVLFASLAGGGIVLALEPDHSSDLPLLSAYGLWSSHILFALLLFMGSLAAMLRIGLPDPWPAVLGILLLPTIFAPVSLVLDIGFGKPDEELVAAADLLTVYLSEIVAVIPVSFATALVLSFALYKEAALRDARAGPARAETDTPAPPLRDLIGAIPRDLGDEIIHMHAQDHYVEVVTAEGSALITERFSDCVGKLQSIDGMQCHRSHWISLPHVKGVSPSGSAYVCTLSNGDRVPVSRRRYAELKQRLDAAAVRRRSDRIV